MSLGSHLLLLKREYSGVFEKLLTLSSPVVKIVKIFFVLSVPVPFFVFFHKFFFLGAKPAFYKMFWNLDFIKKVDAPNRMSLSSIGINELPFVEVQYLVTFVFQVYSFLLLLLASLLVSRGKVQSPQIVGSCDISVYGCSLMRIIHSFYRSPKIKFNLLNPSKLSSRDFTHFRTQNQM